jgi:hypothetical protein
LQFTINSAALPFFLSRTALSPLLLQGIITSVIVFLTYFIQRIYVFRG